MWAIAPATNPHERSLSENFNLNTIPDPRSPSPRSMAPRTPSPSLTPDANGDLSTDVATLSTKLIQAIDLQIKTDEQLQRERYELAAAQDRIARLEKDAAAHKSLVANGILVQRTESDRLQDSLRSEIIEERQKRSSAEKQRRGLELELESLTSSLFEEANSMVASARREHEDAERRNEALKEQLEQAEILLRSHQDQLHELKGVLQHMQQERDPTRTSRPATPILSGRKSARASNIIRRANIVLPGVEPSNPLSFPHLLTPVMRMDLTAFDEFFVLLRASQKTSPPRRVHSGNFGGLNLVGITGTNNSQPSISTTEKLPENSSSLSGSSPRLPGTFNPPPPDTSSSNHATSPTASIFPATLKESKFYKRVLTEDVEPCLRLDSAPGLSWLARRTVLTSLSTGSLIVEPAPKSRFYSPDSPVFACTLCGESRAAEPHLRTHRFRTSDSDDVQRYPLCDYCLSRLRAAADFVGFLRHLRAGYWKVEGAEGSVEEARLAWEECTRLRERMFWARLGGGCVLIGEAEEKDQVEKTETPRLTQEDSEISVSQVSTRSGQFEDAQSEASSTPAVEVERAPAVSVGRLAAELKDARLSQDE